MSAPTERSFMLGLVGEGIGASLTPPMQEREGRAQGLALTYRTIDLTAAGLSVEVLPDLLAWAVRLGFDGLNITHPAKQRIIPLLDAVDPAAAAIGAVNTVVIRDGHTTGHNTDASGFVRGLTRRLPHATDGRVVLLGAGGAGSAIAYAVLQAGAPHLTVVDVFAAKRDELVDRLRASFGPDRVAGADTVDEPLAAAAGLIHATPTGMASHPGLPLDERLLRPDLWVAEVVYFPLETELVRRARAVGCEVVHGGGMAVYQAVGAFELFTGRPADADRMLEHFEELLAARRVSGG